MEKLEKLKEMAQARFRDVTQQYAFIEGAKAMIEEFRKSNEVEESLPDTDSEVLAFDEYGELITIIKRRG